MSDRQLALHISTPYLPPFPATRQPEPTLYDLRHRLAISPPAAQFVGIPQFVDRRYDYTARGRLVLATTSTGYWLRAVCISPGYYFVKVS